MIKNLKITKTHLDTLPIKIFKKLSNVLSLPILNLINQSFSTGSFPEKMKIARITPIYKAGNKTIPSNYRPISSLPYISKLFEKSIANRMMSFCNKFSIIATEQYGFQSSISTCDALIELTETIYNSLDSKKHHFLTLIDFKKAFDCVDHQILISKLESYGIRGMPLRWFTSYLSNRVCYTEIEQITSNHRIFNTGVPQGSILGPLLFLLYINDLPKISDNLQTILFADDTTVSSSDVDLRFLTQTTNEELFKIEQWTILNKLTLNADKTEFLVFSNRKIQNFNNSIILNNTQVTPSLSCKFLGIHLDNKLTFKKHIDYVLGKISRLTGILFRIRDSLTLKARLDYYYAFIYPYLNYNVTVWGGTYETTLQPLVLQHKKVIRTIANADYRDHTTQIFANLKLLKLKDIYLYNLLTHMHKALSKGKFQSIHNLNTRTNATARPKFHRLTLSQHAVSFTGPTQWNKLPNNLRSIDNIFSFKKALKKYLLDDYV